MFPLGTGDWGDTIAAVRRIRSSTTARGFQILFIFLYTFSRFRINQTVFSSPFSRYRKEMQSFCGSLIRRQSSYIGHFKSARPCLAISSSYFHGPSSLGSDSLVLDENPASKNQIFRSFHHLASRSSVTSVCSFFGSYATF